MTDRDDGSGPCTCAPCVERAKRFPARTWRRLERMDMTKPPMPVMRYAGILLVAVAFLAGSAVAGHPLTPLNDWLWAAVLAGFLLLPDVAGFGIAGIRVDLKQTKDEVTRLKQEVNARASSDARSLVITAVGNEAIAKMVADIRSGSGQLQEDERSGHATQWAGTQPGQSTATPDGS